MESLEIEFKTLLTKEEFEHLVYTFPTAKKEIQTNIYFDTPDRQIKDQHSAFRLRMFEHTGEWTLKVKTKEGNIEHTFPLTKAQHALIAENKVSPLTLLPEEMKKELVYRNICLNQLQILAELTTERWEEKLSNEAVIMIDHSFYHGKEDYELEMEVTDEIKGKSYFDAFLDHFHLPYRPSIPKIARASQANTLKEN